MNRLTGTQIASAVHVVKLNLLLVDVNTATGVLPQLGGCFPTLS